jgi:hypothetical protein
MPASPQAVRRRFWLWSQMWSQLGSIDASLLDHRRPSTGCRLALIHPTSRSRFVGASDQLGDVEPTSKLGPIPPHGWEDNWIPTDPEGSFEVIFRFYGPTAPLFDHSWQLNDIQRRD